MAMPASPRPDDVLTRHMRSLFQSLPLLIEGGEGVYIPDGRGRRSIDGQAGLWNIHVGHGRSEIKQAIVERPDRLSHCSLFGGGTTTTPSIELAGLPCRIAQPEGVVTKAIFSSGGSEAEEAAFKLAGHWGQEEERAIRSRAPPHRQP